MVLDEDTEQCPFCSANVTCDHLVAFLDLTFGTCDGGVGYEEINRFLSWLEGIFEEQLCRGRLEDADWSTSQLSSLWRQALDESDRDSGVIVWQASDVLKIVADALVDAGAIDILADDEGGPGMSSAVKLVYAESPQSTIDSALRKLRLEVEESTRDIVEGLGFTTPNGYPAIEHCPICRRLNAPKEHDVCEHYVAEFENGYTRFFEVGAQVEDVWKRIARIVQLIDFDSAELLEDLEKKVIFDNVVDGLHFFDSENETAVGAICEWLEFEEIPQRPDLPQKSGHGTSLYLTDLDDLQDILLNLRKLEMRLQTEFAVRGIELNLGNM